MDLLLKALLLCDRARRSRYVESDWDYVNVALIGGADTFQGCQRSALRGARGAPLQSFARGGGGAVAAVAALAAKRRARPKSLAPNACDTQAQTIAAGDHAMSTAWLPFFSTRRQHHHIVSDTAAAASNSRRAERRRARKRAHRKSLSAPYSTHHLALTLFTDRREV